MAFDKTFFCARCGDRLPRQEGQCARCGFDPAGLEPFGDEPQMGAGGIGWSTAATDSRFSRYQRHRRIYAVLFTVGLVSAIAIFLFASGDLMADQEGLLVMAVLSGLFALIAVAAVRSTKRHGREWTGTILEKQGDPDAKYDRLPLALAIGLPTGEEIRYEVTDQRRFADFTVGDQVRHHQRSDLRFIEQYDKSRALFLYCPACASESDARASFCRACGSPLLKGHPPTDDSIK